MKDMKKSIFPDAVLLTALVLVGGFHEYISCALSAAMCVYLLLRMGREKKLYIGKDIWTSAMVAICLAYGLTCLWAVDRGMAFVGFLKFLPLLLYLICLRQEERTDRVLRLLPWCGAVMAVISAIGMQFSVGEKLFSVAGRLAGFFQYPNTFAVFLLVCQLLVLKKENKKLWDYAVMLVLVAGLLYTGSRTAFVVAVLANVGMLLSMSSKRARLILLSAIAGVCLLGGLLALDEGSVLHRYLNISLTESTFVGRLLYWADALELLLKYPFGMGYMGYYYVQNSIQTGVYSVVYAHNDFLQLVLDVGLLPAGLFIGALIAWFFRKGIPTADKIIVGAICLHSFFDFDLQFMGIFLLLLLLVTRSEEKPVLSLGASLPLKAGLTAVLLVGLYMGAALMLSHFGANALSDALYPWNTQNKLTMLEQEEDLDRANALADEILAQNTHFYAPYTIKMRYSYSQGDFSAVIQNARAVFARNPFGHQEYEAYCQMLINGVALYQKAGDTKSAQVCMGELVTAQELLRANRDRLSPLGKLIDDQPVTELSEELREYISAIGE